VIGRNIVSKIGDQSDSVIPRQMRLDVLSPWRGGWRDRLLSRRVCHVINSWLIWWRRC